MNMDNTTVRKITHVILVLSFKHLLAVEELTVTAKDACGTLGVCSCVSTVVDCTGLKLTDFPENIPHDTTQLNLSYNHIQNLQEKDFAHLLSLSHLDLSSNCLGRLPQQGFGNVSNLTVLQLSQNYIQAIEKQNFGILSEIRAFDLSYNNLTSLPANLFRDLLITYILDFSNNRLTSLPNKLFDANNRTHLLQILFLHRNQLEYLQSHIFHGLPHLRSLCLFHNQIHVLARDTFSGIGVQKIYLFGNKLSSLSNASFQNDNIEEIHVYGNNLTHLNFTSLIGVTNITKVYIDCQKINELQQLEVEIVCVTPKFVPILKMESHLTSVMIREGFSCESNQTGEEIIQCSPCRRGTFGVKGNCVPCFKGGFYQDEIGTSLNNDTVVCKKCPDGTYVGQGEGKSVGDCMVCPDGTDKKTHAGYRACFCLDRYSRKDRFGPCEYCWEDGLDCSKHDYKLLRPGFYWSWDFKNANVTAYKLFVKNLQFENESFDYHTKYTGEIPRTFPCPRHESCKNTAGSVDALCEEGYEGWLCSKCEKHYFSVLDNCVPCPNIEWLFVESSLILCLLVIFSVLIFSFYKRQKSDSGDNRSIIDVMMSRGKIALGFYQVVGEFFTSLHEINWAITLTFIGNIISLIELNVLRIFIRPQCFHEKLKVNPKTEFVIGLTFPVAVTLLSFIIYWFLIARHICKRKFTAVFQNIDDYKKQLKSNLLTIAIIILFLTYPPICTIIFQLYPKACDTFCLDSANSTCKVLLRSDYEIECKDLTVYHIMAYIATAGYVVAYPSFLLFLLRKKSRLFLTKKNEGNSLSIQEEHEENEDELLETLIDNSSDTNAKNPPWMDFLCENYKPQYWYWEIVELARKVTQTVLITLLGWEDKMTVLATIGISVLFLVLHARCLPMKGTFEQSLQMFSLVAILINVLVAAMNVPEEYGDAISVILIVLNILVIVIIAAEVVFGLFVRLKHINVHTKIISFAGDFKTKVSSAFVIRVKSSKGSITYHDQKS